MAVVVPVVVKDWGKISIEVILDKEFSFKDGDMNQTNTVFLHCEQYKWSKSIYNEMLEVYVALVDDLAKEGYKYVASIVPKDDVKTNKFQTMFGLMPEGVIEGSDNNLYTMRVN